MQKLDINLKARTSEGLEVTLNGNIQYRIKDDYDGIVNLFENFGDIGETYQEKQVDYYLSLSNDNIRTIVSKKELFEL